MNKFTRLLVSLVVFLLVNTVVSVASDTDAKKYSVLVVANVDHITADGALDKLTAAGYDDFIKSGSASEGFDVYWPGFSLEEARSTAAEVKKAVGFATTWETAKLSSNGTPDTDKPKDEAATASNGGINIPDAIPQADGLIPELAHIPIPDTEVVFEAGQALSADVDPRATAAQLVHFDMPVDVVVAFYLETLPDRDFELRSGSGGAVTDAEQIRKDGDNVIELTDPNGLPGVLSISPGHWSATTMNINLFLSGTR